MLRNCLKKIGYRLNIRLWSDGITRDRRRSVETATDLRQSPEFRNIGNIAAPQEVMQNWSGMA